MARATVGKWGNNLAVRLPGEIVQATRLRGGELVDIDARDGEILIRRASPQIRLEDLFRGKTPMECRADFAGTGRGMMAISVCGRL